MTEITDAEVAEIQWASSEDGKAAVRSGWEKAKHLGLDKPSGHDLDMADVGAIIWAAHQAAEAMREPGDDEPESVGCAHSWTVLGAQEAPPLMNLFGKQLPRTAVLASCTHCGQPVSWLLDGVWTLADLREGGQ